MSATTWLLGIESGAPHDGGAMVTFIACPFSAEYPEQREGQPPSTRIKIDNVNRELVPQIRAALGTRQYIQLLYREYLGSDLAEPAYGPIEVELRNVQMVGASLTGTAMVRNLQNKRFPAQSKLRLRPVSELVAVGGEPGHGAWPQVCASLLGWLLRRRTAFVSWHAFDVRRILLLHRRILLVRCSGTDSSWRRFDGRTALVTRLTSYSGTRVLSARSSRNVRLLCLRKGRWSHQNNPHCDLRLVEWARSTTGFAAG